MITRSYITWILGR